MSSHETLGEWLEAEPFDLAMSSGYCGFFAHAGNLMALKKHGLAPASARGSSAGGMIAGLYARGMEPENIKEELSQIKREDIWDPGFGLGLLKGALFEEKIRELTDGAQIQDLDIPLSLSVTDVLSRSAEVIRQGDLARAVHASCAFPLLMQPVWIDGRPKLDGGATDHAGMAEAPLDERILFHGLTSRGFRARFDRGHSQAFEGRTNIAILETPDIPPVTPATLEEGIKAFDYTMERTEKALYLPLDGQIA